MHFECGDELIRSFHAAKSLSGPATAPDKALSLGDRGPEVAALQRALNAKAAAGLDADGDFGRATMAAVMAFQSAQGLAVDGVAGPKTLAALGLP
jgi:peptidoglycan hydrolase-like protein with peptidoglycan-binding domain